jgi:predicted secreted protein
MNPVEAVVLYAVIWFLAAFVVLPVGMRSQDEDGRVVPGTPAGAPANFRLRRMLAVTTALASAIWLATFLGLVYSGIGVRDIDIFHRMDHAAPE